MKRAGLYLAIVFLFLVQIVYAWEVDFSRRRKPLATTEAQSVEPKAMDFVAKPRRTKITDRQEVVILNTQNGFVPSNVRLKKGVYYTIHVVNVNKENKNVSFMLDAYNQHHSTYYGETKTFYLDPDKEGVFEFQCPETSSSGKLVVYGPKTQPVQVERSTANSEE
ncbi:MAG: cupredoxin domain-containing protein [Oligoflexia bacterium]|nr:cupredoxin domain-containing protein [Oligoflexia bacterium]